MDLSTYETIDMPLDTVMLLGFYLVLIFYTVFSAVLYYHWNTYATDNKITGTTLIIYALSTVPLLLIMGAVLFLL